MSPSTGSALPGLPAPQPAVPGPRAPALLPAPLPVLVSGNRCGHAPGVLRFAITLPTDSNHARPGVLLKASARIQDYYHRPREGRWDQLSQGERQGRLARQAAGATQGSGSSEPAAGGRLARWRQQRSERREALIGVIALLLAYTDIATLTVAVPAGGGWLGLSAPWIAARAGLSPSRVKRALATLDRADLLAATGQGRRFDRRRRAWTGIGWGPVRRFSFRLVRALGLEVSWDKARRQARKRARPADVPSPARPLAATPAASTPAPVFPPAVTRPAAEARALRQALVSPAARQAQTDPAGHQARIARNRRMAELAAQGLSPTEIRQRLGDAPQPP